MTSPPFTQTDPMPLGAGSVFESSYVYGSNRPTVMVDPSGLRGSAAGRPANPVARVDPTQVPDELALREQCTGTAHDQFVCALWGVWRGADRDFGAFLSTAGTSLGGVTLVRYPNRFRRIPPPGVVLGESGWNRELIDGDGSPARHFIGVVAVAFSWGSTAAATGLERNESGGPGSTEQDRQSGYYVIALAARAGGADYYTDSQFGGFIRNLKSLTGAQAGPVGPGRPGLPPRRTGGEYIRHANRLMGG